MKVVFVILTNDKKKDLKNDFNFLITFITLKFHVFFYTLLKHFNIKMCLTFFLTLFKVQTFNYFIVFSFFKILSHNLKTFNIFTFNLYNMNEKSV